MLAAKRTCREEHLGVEPDAVSPFALVNDRTTAIRPADLARFLEACGHRPRVLDLEAATAGRDAGA